jgi:hypothetical protein
MLLYVSFTVNKRQWWLAVHRTAYCELPYSVFSSSSPSHAEWQNLWTRSWCGIRLFACELVQVIQNHKVLFSNNVTPNEIPKDVLACSLFSAHKCNHDTRLFIWVLTKMCVPI